MTHFHPFPSISIHVHPFPSISIHFHPFPSSLSDSVKYGQTINVKSFNLQNGDLLVGPQICPTDFFVSAEQNRELRSMILPCFSKNRVCPSYPLKIIVNEFLKQRDSWVCWELQHATDKLQKENNV